MKFSHAIRDHSWNTFLYRNGISCKGSENFLSTRCHIHTEYTIEVMDPNLSMRFFLVF